MKPTPGSQLALFASYSYHGLITARDGETLELEADHRRHAEIENAIRDLKYGVGLNHLPSGRFAANGAWLAIQVMAHNLGRWTARIGLGEQVVTIKTLRRRFLSLAGRLTPLSTPPHFASATSLAPGRSSSAELWVGCAPYHSHPDGARPPLPQRPRPRASPVRECLLPCPILPSRPAPTSTDGHRGPQKHLQTAANPKSTRTRARTIASVTSSPPLRYPCAVHRWIRVKAFLRAL